MLKESRRHGEGVVEDPCISLLPNLPGDEDDRRLQAAPGGGRDGGQIFPIVEDCVVSGPEALHERWALEPSGDVVPECTYFLLFSLQ